MGTKGRGLRDTDKVLMSKRIEEKAGRVITYHPSPTGVLFHNSMAYVKGVMGPIGSGSSTMCCMDIHDRSQQQVPDPVDGVRRTRWLVVRNTYKQLNETTIKTWLYWFPTTKMKMSPHPVGVLRVPHMPDKDGNVDGTMVEIELQFFALDRPEQERDLLSLEISGVWINEAREFSADMVGNLKSRIGRYPAKRADYNPVPMGMIMDTNPPDDQSWWYRLAEIEKPVGYEFFRQPPALLRIEDKKTKQVKWVPNDGRDPAIPKAENVENLQEGFNYYLKQASIWSDAKMRVMCCGEYGTIVTGMPVYPEWNDEANLIDEGADPEPKWGLPIFVGTDGGRSPASVILQVMPDGQVVVYDELIGENIGVPEYTERFLRPLLVNRYKFSQGIQIVNYADPSGKNVNSTDEIGEIMHMRQLGVPTMPCPCPDNSVSLRVGAVREAMRRRMPNGKSGLLVSRRCKKLIAGMRGRYHYRKLNTSSLDKRYADSPYKDEWSHVQDALQYAVFGALHPQGQEMFSPHGVDPRIYLPQSAQGSMMERQALATGLDLAGYF